MEAHDEFRDRRGLITFIGIVQLLLGALSLLFFVITLISVLALPQSSAENARQLNTGGVMLGAIFYLVIAAVFAVLGIGAIIVRRWARNLTLLMSWVTIIVGLIVVLFMLVFLGDILSNTPNARQMTPEMYTAIQVTISLVMSVFLILIPALFIWAYQSKNVVLSFNKYDPKERWTDKCPLPVLGISFSLLYTSIVPVFYFSYGFVIPFFGNFITGIPAFLILLINSTVCIYLAIQVYRLVPKSWQYTIILNSLWIASFLITLMSRDILDMYRLMDFPAQQLAILEGMNFLTSGNMLIIMFIFAVAWFAFLVYARRYFSTRGDVGGK
jgi:hypothetical protein